MKYHMCVVKLIHEIPSRRKMKILITTLLIEHVLEKVTQTNREQTLEVPPNRSSSLYMCIINYVH